RGFVPAMVLVFLRRLVGEKQAFDLAATGRLLSAEEAQRAGLVSRVLSPETFDADVASVAAALSGGSATALGLTKKLLYELDGLSVADGIRLGARVNAVARSAPELRELVAGFSADEALEAPSGLGRIRAGGSGGGDRSTGSDLGRRGSARTGACHP